jgi:hypothetical protein
MVKMLSPAFPPRRPSGLVRYALAALVLITIFYYIRSPTVPLSADLSTGLSTDKSSKLETIPSGSHTTHKEEHPEQQEAMQKEKPAEKPKEDSLPEKQTSTASGSAHPIDELIKTAEETFDGMLAKESQTLEEAAKAYRERRGRHPPPGFKEWYEFASERKAVMVEDFFDQIYHDLNPFWALDADYIRKEAEKYEMTINIRNGRASAASDWFWTKIWLDLVKTIEHLLPDMDIALNAMDEPRMVVPWEEINRYVSKADKEKSMPKASSVISKFQELPNPGESHNSAELVDKDWERKGTCLFTNLHFLDLGIFSRTTEIGLILTLDRSFLGYRTTWLPSRECCPAKWSAEVV